jgi:hypothetical protein
MASRRVLGFALSEHHDAQLAYGALAMAVAVRGGPFPASSCTPTRAASWQGPRGLRPAGHPPMVRFDGAEFSGGMVRFGGAEFSDGMASFYVAEFCGDRVRFDFAKFSGDTVDFSNVHDWSYPPTFHWDGAPPAGVILPASATGTPA